MRIVVHGQQAFGKSVLEALLERGEQVVAVYVAPDKAGHKVDPLKEAALERGLWVYQPSSFRRPEVREQLAAFKPDLCVMAYVTLFVPEDVLNVPTHGTIQYHPSLLPRHRGPSSINWPIIHGAIKTGVTIFWPDNGLDTGPILVQKETPINDDDTLGSLYFDRLFPMGVAAMMEAVELVRAGKAPKIRQDEAQATYESWCKAEHVEIDWTKPQQQVWNLIRGANPQPGAWTKLDGKVVQIFDCAKRPAARSAAPGEVTETSAEGFVLACGDGRILVQRVKPADGAKVKAGEFAAATGLQVGARFG
ncbi:MAG: methionyl-tRNA formyltransferase [Pseudomonadota bacterium]